MSRKFPGPSRNFIYTLGFPSIRQGISFIGLDLAKTTSATKMTSGKEFHL